MVAVDEYFSVVALFILFRETIEASIICGVLLQFLARTMPRLKPAVWWGVAGGIGCSIVFGVIFVVVFYTAKNNLFAGENKDIFSGVIALIAAALITYLGFKMFCFIGWEDKWKRKLESAAKERMAKENAEREAAAAKAREEGELDGALPADSQLESAERGASNVMAKAPSIGLLGAGSTPSALGPESITSASLTTAPSGHAFETKDSAMTMSSPPPVKLDKLSQGGSSSGGNGSSSAADCKDVVLADGASPEAIKDEPNAIAAPEYELNMAEPSRKEWWNIFMLVWTTVTREGIESVVFLAGVGSSVKASAIPLAGFVGIVAGLGVGFFLYYSGKQVKDLKWFLIIMGIVVFFIAAGQVSLAIDALYRAGMFGYCSPWNDERPWHLRPVWDISGCCGDTDEQNKFLSLTRAIFGYQDQPTPVEIIFYCGYWVFIIIIMLFKWRQGSLFDADWKYKREQRRLAKIKAQEEVEAEALAAANWVPPLLAQEQAPGQEVLPNGGMYPDKAPPAADAEGGATPLVMVAEGQEEHPDGHPPGMQAEQQQQEGFIKRCWKVPACMSKSS